MKRLVIGVSILLVVLVGGFAAAIMTLNSIDWSQYEQPIADAVKKATGRELRFSGSLKVNIGLTPGISADIVTLQNVEWASRDDMLTVEHVEAQLKLLPLVFGKVELNQLEIVGLDLLLETDPQGRGNWEFELAGNNDSAATAQEPASDASAWLTTAVLTRAVIRDAVVVYRDGATDTTQRIGIDEFIAGMESAAAPLVVQIEATYGQESVELEGEFRGIGGLLSGEPIDLDVTANTLGATIEIDGSVAAPLEADGMDIAIEMVGDSLTRLTEFIGSPISGLENYRVSANIAGNAEALAVSNLVIALEAAGASVDASGGIQDVIALQGIDIALTAKGPSLTALTRLAGTETAGLGAFSVAANLAGSSDSLIVSDLAAQLSAAGARVNASGRIGDAVALSDINVALSIEGNSLAELSTLAGTDMPDLGGYRLAANVSGSADMLDVDDLSLTVADMQIDGNLRAGVATQPMRLEATLRSPRIDLTRVLLANESADVSPDRSVAQSGGPNARLFSGDPLPIDSLDALESINAVVNLEIGELIFDPETKLSGIDLGLDLAPGKVRAKPLKLTFMDASIEGRAGLDAVSQGVALSTVLNIRHPSIGDFVEDAGDTLLTGGPLDMNLDVAGRGMSVREIMASLNGSLALELGTARIDNKWIQRAFADAKTLLKKDSPTEPIDLHCVTTRFAITNGVAVADSLVVDTRGISLFGNGRVDLRDESLNLDFDRLATGISASSVLPPFRIRGTLASPSGNIDAKALAGKTLGYGASLITKSEVDRADVVTATGPARCRERLVVYNQVQQDRALSREKTAEILSDEVATKAAEATKGVLGKVGGFLKKKTQDKDD